MPEFIKSIRNFFLVSLLVGLSATALAADPQAQPVGDPVVEARVTRLGSELRCLTCMGQSIADSHSGFSDDMKREMREMIAAGKSDEQIMEFMVQRYGDFVLYRPPVKATTYLLWGGPFVLLLVGVGLLLLKLRRRAQLTATPLDVAEEKEAARLLEGGKKGQS